MKANHRSLKFALIGAIAIYGMFLTAALVPNASAQNSPPLQGRFGRGHFAGAGAFWGGKVVTGAPYSAQAVTEHTQTLPDGNTIHTTTTANLYRDSQGRTRREQEIGAIGPWATQGTPRKVISISDPVNGLIHTLNPDTLVAHEMRFRPHTGAWQGAETARQKPENPNIKTESLGTQTIGGVTAQGTRITRTIPAGQVGNQAPIVIVSEHWYSPELQTDVMRKQINPEFGSTTFQLANIVRAEPDPALFQVPSNYEIKSGRPAANGAPASGTPDEQ